MKQFKVRIVENKKISQDFYKMRIESSYLAKNTRPGQFVEVRCSDSLDPLLRRPLGAHKILKDGIELLYEVVGAGTALLSQKKEKEYLDVIGPLGNGFDIKPSVKTAILVAGGIGVAPLLALAESLAYSVKRIAYSKILKSHVFIGARTKSHILCERDFRKLSYEIHISTEDGSKGKRGIITKLLSDFLNAKRYPLNAIIYACGPAGMLKAVAAIAKKNEIPCQVSLEERMACGVGVCLGCPVKVKAQSTKHNTQYEYKMVCKDGPVFDAKEIAW